MRLLLLTPQLPYPPRQGTTIRNYFLLKHLARRHTVDLLTFLAPDEHLTADSPLHKLCRRVAAVPQPRRSLARRALDTLRSPLPDMALRLEEPAMHALVDRWMAEQSYDVVQIEGIEMAQYGLRARRSTAAPQRPLLVFDDHNCEYLLQKRNALTDLRQPTRWLAAAYSVVQWQKLLRYETQICQRADVVLAVSVADKAALAALTPGVALTVISNGIDLEDYQPVATDATPVRPPFALVFTGKMDYRPNIDAALWFGQHVLPLVRGQEPHVVFQIVGMNPHPRLDVLRGSPAIEITGAVPDAKPFIEGATVYVVPMRVGGGTRLKVLEAFACGRAVVSTGLGVEGIPVQNGRELLVADTPATFAQAVVHLLSDAQGGGQQARQLGQAARALVEQHYSWSQIIPRLEQVYVEALAERSESPHSA
jgi:sugar transferase (PEP-CTERM/EpsH1 system associated)